MSGTARQKVQRWVFVLTFLLGIPALLIWVSMPFLDMSHATYLTATKDYKGAIKALNRAISMNGGLSAAYVKRGYDYELMNDPAKALADYDAAARINPQDWAAFNNRAWLTYQKLQAQKDDSALDGALMDATRAVDLCADCAQAYHTRGMIFRLKGDNARALVDFDKAIELDPKMGAAYADRAQCYSALGRTTDALKDLARAQELGARLAPPPAVTP
jgi:tetratricopeptide (TPR) repeat protein